MEEICLSRETVKEFISILNAFSEDKVIQWYDDTIDKWVDVSVVGLEETANSYRIKPEPKYRPFKNADECWAEMQKHQPFGWLKRIGDNQYCLLTDVSGEVECEGVRIDGDGYFWDTANYEYTFVDGTPFGIKEGE